MNKIIYEFTCWFWYIIYRCETISIDFLVNFWKFLVQTKKLRIFFSAKKNVHAHKILFSLSFFIFMFFNNVWVPSPARTQDQVNKSTYLYVYSTKHIWLLTMKRIYTLFIVKHLSYICIVLWRVRILFFKAVANFCRKGGDWGQANIPHSSMLC